MAAPTKDFFAVTFTSSTEAEQFALTVCNAAGGALGIVKAASASPPIAFMAPAVKNGIGAYISVGTAQLLKLQAAPFAIDLTPVPLQDLPDGFSLLVGDQSDYHEYLHRRAT